MTEFGIYQRLESFVTSLIKAHDGKWSVSPQDKNIKGPKIVEMSQIQSSFASQKAFVLYFIT